MTDYRAMHTKSQVEISEEAYRQYFELVNNYKAGEENSRALGHMLTLQKESPAFLPVYDWLTRYYLDRYGDSQDKKHLRSARNLLDGALARLPNESILQFNKIKLLLHEKQHAEIPALIAKLRLLSVDETTLLELEARYWEAQGDDEKALQKLDAALSLRNSADLHRRKATIFLYSGQTNKAREILAEVLELSPNYPLALGLLADIALMEGSAKEAIQAYSKLLTVQDRSLNHNNLGLSYYLLGDFNKARSAFESAVETSPHDPSYLFNLADSEWLLKNIDRAKFLYRKTITILDTNKENTLQYYSIKAQALNHLGDHQAALIHLKQALEIGPDNLEALYAAAIIYSSIGETTSAQVYITLSLEQGMSANWFSLPWFEHLNEIPNFSLTLEK